MSDCLFCKIIAGNIPAKKEFENKDFLAFYDINPQAPVHLLVIPKKHVAGISELQAGDAGMMGQLIHQAKEIAKKNKWGDYRLVFNNGAGAGQSVFHIHLHLLSGRPMKWPPG